MMNDDVPLPSRLSGAVWGHLVGDAVGVPYEFRAPEAIGEVAFGAKGTHSQPAGTWSDDGSLMLALLDSLLTAGFDPEDQGRRALAWWRKGAYTPDGNVFDIGNTTASALAAIERGTAAVEAGPNHEHSQANGSLMRILPLGLWGHGRPRSELARDAATASRVTHGHSTCRAVCAVYTLIVDDLLGGRAPGDALGRGFADARLAFAADPEIGDAIERIERWQETNRPSGSGGALNGFWSAWTAFVESRDFPATVRRAVAYGHDTDTTAAIAGGLAGARWGVEAIPEDWLRGMRGREVVVPLVDRLIVRDGWKTSLSHPVRVDWVDLERAPKLRGGTGRLGMTFLIGKQHASGYHGPWWRDLEADADRLRDEYGVTAYLQLVEDHELASTRTGGLGAVLRVRGIDLLRHAVVDMNVPTDVQAFGQVIDGISARLRAGEHVVVACRGGLGRTGTAVACLLVDAGLDADAAVRLTREARSNTIERGLQVEFVQRWASARPKAPN